MPIKITLRMDRFTSPFRRMLLGLLDPSIGDSLVICSGYIWEPKGGQYQILADDLLSAIAMGCPKGVTVVGGKLAGGRYRAFFSNFVNRLGAVTAVKSYTAPLDNWHAKIAIRMSNGRPVAGIVGSSNLTGPAYGEGRPPTPYTPGWNYESDVLLWIPNKRLTRFFNELPLDGPFGAIDAILRPDADQPNEAEQFERLFEEIMREAIEF